MNRRTFRQWLHDEWRFYASLVAFFVAFLGLGLLVKGCQIAMGDG